MTSILVVEDDRVSMELQKFILEHEGYKVILAHDGAEALRKVEEENPDLVVLDVILPGIDGFQVCQLLKHSLKTRNLPIIFVTSKYRKEDEKNGLELGADDYIRKPFEPEEYTGCIKRLLGKNQK